MRRSYRFVPALLAALAAPSFVLAAEPNRIAIDTRPVEVTVYDSQATVSRKGEIELPAGDSVVVLNGLPPDILQDSVTVKGTSAAKLVIGSIDTATALGAEAIDKKRAEIDAQIRDIDDKIGLIDVRLAAFEAQKNFIALLARLPGTEPPRPAQAAPLSPPPSWTNSETWKSAWTLVHDGVLDAETNIYATRIERRKLEEEKARLAATANDLGSDSHRALEISVPVTADKPAKLTLLVSYQVPHASWRPGYDLRLDTASGKVTVLRQAMITQATGEDWRNVALRLSTARPARGIAPPALPPQRVGLADPRALRQFDAAAKNTLQRSMNAPVASSAPAPALPAPEEAQIAQAETTNNGLAVEFAVPGPVSVPADSSQHKVKIGENTWDAEFFARTTPRLDRNAYLQARFKNATEAPFLPGTAAAYLDGVYVGRENLPLARPGEEIAAAFGPDDRIRVTFAPQDDKTGVETALIGQDRRVIERGFLTTIKNFHTRPIAITVLDRVPVSSDDALKVEVTITPEPTTKDVDDKPGIIAWTRDYKPEEEAQFKLHYRLTAPKEKAITGL